MEGKPASPADGAVPRFVVRIPICLGAVGLQSLVTAQTCQALAVTIAAFGLFVMRDSGAASTMLFAEGWVMVVGALGVYAVIKYREAWTRRASDFVAYPRGVVGIGDDGGLEVLPWHRVAPEKTVVAEANGGLHLYVMDSTGDGVVAAIVPDEYRDYASNDEAPAESLKAVAEWVRRQAQPAAAPQLREDRVLRCPSCGGIARAATLAVTTCEYCNKPLSLPDPIRQEIERRTRLTRDRSKIETEVRQLLEQPDAVTTNRTVALGIALSAGAPLLGLLLVCLVQPASASLMLSVIAILALTVGLSLAAWLKATDTMSHRGALRGITSGFAALAPAAPGAPHSCRCCHGPLAAAGDDKVVVACEFCGAQNVLGLDLHARLESTASAFQTLDELLDQRQGRLSGIPSWFPAAIVVAAVALALLAALAKGN